MVTAPAPGTPEWMSLVTASKVAGILGVSPWDSPYSTWLRMRGDIAGADQSRPMVRGHALENAVLDWWLNDNPHLTEEARQVWRPMGEWAGATPDMDVRQDGGPLELVDAKTIGYDDDWEDGPPTHYLASSMWQLACTPDAERVHLAVLFGRPFDLRTYTVERDDALIADIVTRCRDFYESLASDDAPDLDDTVATYEAVKAQHPDIEAKDSDSERVEIDAHVAHRYVTADLAAKDAATELTGAKSALLDAMGRARLATCDGATVARRQPNRYGVSLVRVAKHITPPAEGIAS